MTFMVQDLLDFAQIKAKKFRKNITEFNIRDAVESVMIVQKKKATDQHIELFATYENISEDHDEDLPAGYPAVFSPLVCTDEARVKQVLLGLQSNALKFT
mmetsp:Transcript_17577/g.27158  ORF Transcript_17577/g.27158 Transcript_17577/m.27158 type:complete len:100 (-) Transcript_17577:1055-1354(-)